MDPLSALAIAAAVFQFLELGGKLCIKGWEKYKQIQQTIPDDQKLAQKEEELRKIFEDLSGQISWFRQVSTSIVVSQHPTPTQAQLLKLSSQCASLASDFERIKSQMKLPNNRAIKSARRKDLKNAEVQRNKEEIEPIKKCLKLLKQETMDFILLSLWDDSKRTKQWELHFSSQLEKLIELLGSAEKVPINNPQESVLPNQMTLIQFENPENHLQQPGACLSPMTDEETTRLRNALQPLIRPGTEPVSLKQLASDMIEHFQVDSRAMNAIREELIGILWKKDWKLDTSMTPAKVDTIVVGHAIAAGIHFNTIQIREDSIPKSFRSTYSWILQDESPKKDNMHTRNSFPRWLDDDSEKVYWITGKPGSGKSTIMKLILNQKYLTDRLSQSPGSLRLLLVKYYAWLSGDTLQKSIEGFKRTIIFQALKEYPDLAPMLTPRRWAFCQALRNTSGLPNWDTWEVDDSFEALLASCGETIKLALFIDGLDEFDAPPFEVIRCIHHMMERCPNGLKICAASRPWQEFLDEFNEGPMLQMHLLTENDMRVFVNESFETNKGFVEQREINPEEATQLLKDIVQRANGVFLWVSIVVQHLSTDLSEGQSISQARQTLEALPTNISSLYDAIWASLRPNHLPDASHMIRILRAFRGPLPWLMLWLIEESRFTTIDKIIFPETDNKITAAQRSLKRKLATRTKCILEINEGGESSFVDFIHRTARDWAIQPNQWRLICSHSSECFDPYLCIFKGDTLELLRFPARTMIDLGSMEKLLRHASQVKDIPENESDFVDYLNLVNARFESILKTYTGTRKETEGLGDRVISRFMSKNGRNFLEVAAHFAILPYIKAVACSHPNRLSQMFSEGSLRLVNKAICGNREDGESISQATWNRRLTTVKYLLEQDVYQWREHVWNNGIRNLKNEIREYSKLYPGNEEYYSTVILYLDKKESELSISSRIRSFFTKRM